MEEKNIKILAIESSCDETAAAVVENGRKVLSNVISTQIDIHTLYGGVVPEIASRKHLERINQVVKEALKQASVTLEDIDAVAVTYGPGLVGALLVGTAEAKAIAYAAGKPLVGVHHIEGHIAANYIENQDLEPPFMCLIVSGGHTHLVVVEDYDKFQNLISLDAQEMMQQVKLSIRWPEASVLAIREVQRSTRQQSLETRMPLHFQRRRCLIIRMTLASVV